MRLALLVLLGACRYGGAFECEMNDQCRERGETGVCQVATGYCSYPDPACPSGQRYGDNAGGGLAQECSAAMAMVDAAPPDAPPFDPSTCAAAFDRTYATLPGARYALVSPQSAAVEFDALAAMCIALDPGSAHPATADSVVKLKRLGMLVNGNGAWVGVIQNPAATGVADGWITMTDAPITSDMWRTAPDDRDGGEADHAEQAAILEPIGALADQGTNLAAQLLCECDGVAIGPLATQYLAENTWD